MLVRVNGLYENTQLRDLIAEVDSWPREPTEEDIRYLAEKYQDTEEYVRYTFRARRWREEQKCNWRRAAGARGIRAKRNHHKWLEEEKEYVLANWQRQSDRKLAEALSALPCNRARGVVRNSKMVWRFRERNGLVRGHDRPMLPEEEEFIRAHWEEMDDWGLAEGLTALPCNVERGMVRGVYSVRKMRRVLGLKRRGK